MSQDARRLLRKMLCRVDELCFQGYFATGMITVTDFNFLPGFECQGFTSKKRSLKLSY